MGSIDSIVANKLVFPDVPPVTRLPLDTRRSPMRPDTGARSSVNSRSSAAWRSAACWAATDASAVRLACVRWSKVCWVMTAPTVRPCARKIAFRERERGLGLREAGLRLSKRDLERPAIDREQKIARLHQLAVLKMDPIQIAGNTRPHLHSLHGDQEA